MTPEERLEQKYQEVLLKRNQVAVEKAIEIMDIFQYRDCNDHKVENVAIVANADDFAVGVYSWKTEESVLKYCCQSESFSRELQAALDEVNEKIDGDDGERVVKLLQEYCDIQPSSVEMEGFGNCSAKIVKLKEQ